MRASEGHVERDAVRDPGVCDPPRHVVHRRTQRIAIVLIAAFAAASARAEPVEFSQANEKYAAGDFAAAKALYEDAVRSGDYSAGLFYNLGNADFRLGDRGRAALNYRRALALKPGLAEADANLRFVRKDTGAKVPPPPSIEPLFPALPRHGWTVATAVSGWLSAFLIAALLTGRRRAQVWTGAIAAIVVCAYAATGLWIRHAQRNVGVVVAGKAEARYAPTETAKVADTLPAASEVQVLVTRGHWTYCVLPDGGRAWLPADSVATLDPMRS